MAGILQAEKAGYPVLDMEGFWRCDKLRIRAGIALSTPAWLIKRLIKVEARGLLSCPEEVCAVASSFPLATITGRCLPGVLKRYRSEVLELLLRSLYSSHSQNPFLDWQ